MAERDARDHFRTALRILNVRLRFVLIMALTGLIAARWDWIAARWERWTSGEQSESIAAAVEYYCPMHPSVVRAEPGNCPICGMPLSSRAKGETIALPEGVLGRVTLTPYRIALGGVATSEVIARSLRHDIRAFGIVELEERRVARVTSRVAGRIERILADYPDGTIAAGEPLVEIYSPELLATAREYLAARRAGESSPSLRVLADAARERLRLWGVAESEIAALESGGETRSSIIVRSPIHGVITRREILAGEYAAEGAVLYEIADLSRVWVTASIPESDAGPVKAGMPVEVTVTALPGRTFSGEVNFIEPLFGAATRSLRVRAYVQNPDRELRPGMYAEVRFGVPATGGRAPGAHAAPASGDVYECPMKCDGLTFTAPGTCPVCHMDLEKVATMPAGQSLAVPESAVIDTGTRKVVYLEREPGVFDAIEVALGPLSGGYYPVLDGLRPGDRVVTRGAFLVDAELRLSPGAAGAYFGAEAPAAHEH